MASTSVPASTKEATTHLERGWAIYSENASSIIASYSKGVWLVPSQSGNGVYEVRVTHHGEVCECLAWAFSPDRRCKHTLAARYAAANSEFCSICSHRFPYGGLSPIDGDHYLGLACKGCGS